MNQRRALPDLLIRFIWPAIGLLIILGLPGCATTPKRPAIVTENGLSLVVGFVYEEKVYTVEKPFSLESCFWDAAFPVLGSAFRESRSYPDRWTAVQDPEVDVIALVENIVHGAPDRHKFSLSLRIMTRDEKTILAKSLQQDASSLETCPAILTGMATALKETIETSSRMVMYSKKRTVIEAPGSTEPAR